MNRDVAAAPPRSPGEERRNLGVFVATLAVGGWALDRLAGPPHLPEALPSSHQVTLALVSSTVPSAAITYSLTAAAWLIWLWLVGSLLLRFAVVGADVVLRGAGGVRLLRNASDRLTLPLVRRLVDGAVTTITVVQLVSHTPLAAAAASPVHPPPIVTQVVAHRAAPGPAHQAVAQTVTYRVQSGDSLWSIAERFWGHGEEFPRIVAANLDRPMPGGAHFTRAGVIHPGWVLLIPQAPTAPSAAAAPPMVYVVQQGDSLSAIAERFYGDAQRWPDLYRANKGARAPTGWPLTNPNRIWPGMQLVIPGVPRVASAAPPPAIHAATGVAKPTPSLPAHGRPSVPAGAQPPSIREHAATPTAPSTSANTATAASKATAAVSPSATPAPTARPARHDTTPSTVVTRSRPAASPTRAATPRPRPVSRNAHAAPAGELLVLGFGGVAVVGAASLLARRRRRSVDGSPHPDEDPLPIDDGFAAAAAARVVAVRTTPEDAEPATLVATQMLRFLGDRGVPGARIVFLCQGRRSATVTLTCRPEDHGRLVDLAPALARHLGGGGKAMLTRDGDVVVALTRLDGLGLLLPSAPVVASLTLLPLGVLPDRQLLYAPWDALGHVLIAGAVGGGSETVLTSLLGGLASRLSPDELQLRLIVGRHTLPEPLLHLPHVAGSAIDPPDTDAVQACLRSLQEELDRRMAEAPADVTTGPVRPYLVLVIDDLASLAGAGMALDALLLHGPAFGIRLLAATTRPLALDDATLRHFTTRLALRLADDDSVLLLGHANAADLAHGGAMLARIAGRDDLRLRAFRITDQHLEHLLATMERPIGHVPASGHEVARPTAGAGADAEMAPVAGAARCSKPPVRQETSGVPGAADRPRVPGEGASAGPDAGGADGDEETPRGALDVDASPADAPALSGRTGDDDGDHDDEVAESPPEGTAGRPPTASGVRQPELRVECFGTFRVLCDGQELKPEGVAYNMYRPWEVLAYLAVQPPGPVPRNQLIDDVWADREAVEPERLMSRVRTVLSRLRKLFEQQVPGLPGDVVSIDRQGKCWLNTRLVQSEAHEFLELVRRSANVPPTEAIETCRRARELYRGDLLADCQYEWLYASPSGGGADQQTYRQKYHTVTLRLAQLYAGHGQPEQAASLYRQMLREDAANEKIACRLFACHAQSADAGALRRDFRWLDGLHREQYRVPLGPKVVAAYEGALQPLTHPQAAQGASAATSAS